MDRKLAEFTLEAFSRAEYYCWKADKEFQVADERYEYLKEHGKDLLAALMTDIKASEESRVSEVALERMARSGEKWQAHREGEHVARKTRNELRFKSRAAQRYFECIQSGLAYKRAELHRIGGQDG